MRFSAIRSTYKILLLTHNLIEMPLNAFANRTDPDQAALVRGLLCWLLEKRYTVNSEIFARV